MRQAQVSTTVKRQTLNPSWSERFALDRLHPEASSKVRQEGLHGKFRGAARTHLAPAKLSDLPSTNPCRRAMSLSRPCQALIGAVVLMVLITLPRRPASAFHSARRQLYRRRRIQVDI